MSYESGFQNKLFSVKVCVLTKNLDEWKSIVSNPVFKFLEFHFFTNLNDIVSHIKREPTMPLLVCDFEIEHAQCKEITAINKDAVMVYIARGEQQSAPANFFFCVINPPLTENNIYANLMQAANQWLLKFGPPESFQNFRLISSAVNKRIAVLRNILERTAIMPSNILIIGETGTGKEIVARAIYELSMLTLSGPFVAINCAAIPEQLLESQLFGHMRGSFTGADSNSDGLLMAANNGIAFMDEIGEMPLALQAKLLRILQEKKVKPIGSTREIDLNVKFIFATNRDLTDEIKAGRFRRDLFFRINMMTLTLPPLRERREDIQAISHAFLTQCSQRGVKKISRISPEVIESFNKYSWPGNVRELRNVVEYAYTVCDSDCIELRHIPQNILKPVSEKVAELLLRDKMPKDVEKKVIEDTLQQTGGNVSKAAQLLGVSRQTLYRKMADAGIKKL